MSLKIAVCLVVAVSLAGVCADAQEPPNPDGGYVDCNHDGHADIFWGMWPLADINSNSDMRVWYMDGPVLEASVPTDPVSPAATNWKFNGVAPFYDASSPDFLFRNTTSGKLVVWHMSCPARNGSHGSFFLGPPETDWNWQIIGLNDMGSMLETDSSPSATPDGNPDLIWRHTNGTVRIWYTRNRQYTNVALLSPPIPPGFIGYVMGTGEFGTGPADPTPDGHPDLLSATTDGSNNFTVTYLNGNVVTTQGTFLANEGLGWYYQVVSIADYGTSSTDLTLDGKADLMIRRTLDGAMQLWFMNGMTLVQVALVNSGGAPLFEPSLDWRGIGPR